MVRAKMRVTRVPETCGVSGPKLDGQQIELMPVYDDKGPNKTWSKWTPSGKVEMHITNPDAFQQFKLGGTFFVDFTEVDDETEQPVGG